MHRTTRSSSRKPESAGERVRHATLRDVAEAAQISVATVSRALTGHPYVSAEVMERVQAAATALGYQPNEGARNLRASRSMTLGILCYQLRQLPMIDFIDGFGAGAEKAGYVVLVANARGDSDQYQRMARRLFERRIDGLLVTSPGELGGSLTPYRESGVPVALTLWRAPEVSDVPLITTSELTAVRAAMARLRELGHRSLAYFGTPRTQLMQRPASLTQAAMEHDISCQLTFLAETTDAQTLARHLTQAMDTLTSATAIAFNHSLVGPMMAAVRLLGLRIPDDLSLFTFTDYQTTDMYLEPALAAIHTDVVEMGAQSAEIIIRWITSGASPPSITDLNLSSWVEIASIGPSPRR